MTPNKDYNEWTHLYCEVCGVQPLMWGELGRCKEVGGVYKSDDDGDWFASDLMCSKCHLVTQTVYYQIPLPSSLVEDK